VDVLDDKTCYRALRSRDARFDGRFFTAVKTTGIFCRPICPARTPNRENCAFYPCAAAALEAGFRPCLRCRPEASPSSPAWGLTSTTVARAVRLIGDGALDTGGVDELAARVGVGARHLRTLFQEHLGASPLAVASTRRVLFAKKLLDETKLPITEIALSSGFSSLRRFNAAMSAAYGRPPRSIRRRMVHEDAGLSLALPYHAPFEFESIGGYLAPRAIPGVESVTPQCWRRAIVIEGVAGTIEVRPAKGQLVARIDHPAPTALLSVVERLRRLFDLAADPASIAARLRGDPDLAVRLRRARGLRVPGAFDGFELAVRAILGQQVTVKGATSLTGRVVEAYGTRVAGQQPMHLFPSPDRLVAVDAGRIGIPTARAAAISALARAVVDGEVMLDGSRDLDDTRRALLDLPGIGPWTVEYIAMRALRDPDAFPAGDLGLRRALGGIDARALEKRAERYRPFRAYAAMLLWTT
jgi:AraC family transcriptional regulator, regulatory protein of adaptative response / DNA-3-methyladenine glycosylase II